MQSVESGGTITLEQKQHFQHMPGWRGAERAQGKNSRNTFKAGDDKGKPGPAGP